MPGPEVDCNGKRDHNTGYSSNISHSIDILIIDCSLTDSREGGYMPSTEPTRGLRAAAGLRG